MQMYNGYNPIGHGPEQGGLASLYGPDVPEPGSSLYGPSAPGHGSFEYQAEIRRIYGSLQSTPWQIAANESNDGGVPSHSMTHDSGGNARGAARIFGRLIFD